MAQQLAPLSLESLIESVGRDAFEAECAVAMTNPKGGTLNLPHQFADRLWYEGDETHAERLEVAIELYLRMPGYAQLMYWQHPKFGERDQTRMWSAYREFLGDPRPAIAEPAAYSLWVDWFEDVETVEQAWREVSATVEPRRPRLDRVVGASGPVPWELKSRLYAQLADEGGWDETLLEGLYGSVFDVYGSVERTPALRILERLRLPPENPMGPWLSRALRDPGLPAFGGERRQYAIERYSDD